MTKEQLAEQYTEGKSSSSVFQEAHKRDFLAGFSAKEELIKETLNTLTQLVGEINNLPLAEQIFKSRDLDRLNNKIEVLKSLIDED